MITEYSGVIPNRAQGPTAFNTNMNSLLNWFPTFASDFNATLTSLNASVTAAEIFAAEAAQAANAVVWSSGVQFYAGDVCYSPTTGAAFRAVNNNLGDNPDTSATGNWVHLPSGYPMNDNFIINAVPSIWKRNASTTGQGYICDRWYVWDSLNACLKAKDTSFDMMKITAVGNYSGSQSMNIQYAGVEKGDLVEYTYQGSDVYFPEYLTLSFKAAKTGSDANIGVLFQVFDKFGNVHRLMRVVNSSDLSKRNVITIKTPDIEPPINSYDRVMTINFLAGYTDTSKVGGSENVWWNRTSTGNNYYVPYAIDFNNGDQFYLGHIKLEKGKVATPFHPRPQSLEHSLCERYYQNSTTGSEIIFSGDVTNAGYYRTNIVFRNQMRILPTVVAMIGTSGTENFEPEVGTLTITSSGIREERQADGTGRGLFQTGWTAAADFIA